MYSKLELNPVKDLIPSSLLISAGAVMAQYSAGETIFNEGKMPLYYFQIMEGKVKVNNYAQDGREFIQNVRSEGESFGEALLFTNKPYPMNAVALIDCQVIKLNKDNFMELLKKNPEVYFDLCKALSERLYYQYIMSSKNSSNSPMVRLMAIMEYFKNSQQDKGIKNFEIPFTRQQLASLTGLCVETVMRSLKTMERENIIKTSGRKIYF